MSENSETSNRALHCLGAREVSDGLGSGRFRSVDVVDALIERRREIDPLLGAFVVSCDDAMKQAEEADKARATGALKSPLHGVPVSIKDSVDLRGYDCTMGIRARQGRPAARDAVLVAELRRLGLVFLGKTNVPQALLAQETNNPLFGSTVNPWSVTRTPGGSSGGEAAAVATGLSPLGIGTDIGGSIRIPAHFCGVVGFKPTLNRWSNRGSNSAIPGQELVNAQIGTLSRSVGDAKFLWRHIDCSKLAAADPSVPVLATPLQSGVAGMTIGVIEDDAFLPPVASIRRAVQLARAALEEAGAMVVSHVPVSSREILRTWLSALSADNGRTLMQALAGDAVCEPLSPLVKLLKIPGRLRRRLGGLLSAIGEPRLALLLEVVGEKSVDEFWKLCQRRTELRQQEFDQWNRAGLDAVLCPPHVVPAMGLGQSGDLALSLGPMFRWTLLNFPAGVVPVTRVLSRETAGYEGGHDTIAKKIKMVMKGSVGLPVGVQIVARPFQEATLLAVMEAVEKHLPRSELFPSTPVGVADPSVLIQ